MKIFSTVKETGIFYSNKSMIDHNIFMGIDFFRAFLGFSDIESFNTLLSIFSQHEMFIKVTDSFNCLNGERYDTVYKAESESMIAIRTDPDYIYKVYISIPGIPCSIRGLKFFTRLLTNIVKSNIKYHITRLDICIDDYSRTFYNNNFDDLVKNNLVVGYESNCTIDSVTKNRNGKTIYLGSRRSSKFFRYYQKMDEYNNIYDRIETEFKKHYPDELVKIISNMENLYDIKSMLVSHCIFFSVIESSGMTALWFKQFLKKLSYVDIDSISESRIKTIDKTIRFLKHSVAPSLAVLHQVLGEKDFEEFIQRLVYKGNNRLDSRAKTVIEDTQAMFNSTSHIFSVLDNAGF